MVWIMDLLGNVELFLRLNVLGHILHFNFLCSLLWSGLDDDWLLLLDHLELAVGLFIQRAIWVEQRGMDGFDMEFEG